ncbi:hypothetical protein [Chryseobacterium indoltheticum]|uniref:Uncharacterized protein n=1 Tax=Chryseobacterium indoltheticum TaxID=254 RepID=A0A381FR93_9FLAO|nr:hypothetical protein [Chryseobacterium indoltheticum]SUX48662.1 Uncharacterised protein [Chryseobacterium indoltheticum]
MKKNSIILNSILFGSLLLNLVNLKFFEQTLIRIEYLLFFYLIGFLTYFLSKKKLSKISNWNNFNKAIFCIIVVGANLTALCLGLNLLFASQKTKIESFSILRKTNIPGGKYNRSKRTPAIIFETKFNDTKRLTFTIDYKKQIEKSSMIELELSEGLFGFEIIRSTKLR